VRDWSAANGVREGAEPAPGDEIVVEIRLGDETLARRISDWIGKSAAFMEGASGAGRSVLIADHVPDDAEAPVIVLAHEDEPPGWPRDERVAARLPPTADFVKLRIALEAAAHGMSVKDLAPASSATNGKYAGLTHRENEVLLLLAEGASNKVIARRLGISAHTVKFHVASILVKLGAASRTEAVMLAIRLGLFMV
jgi:DNA-binding NarL/FixJ family response regulator